MTFYCLFFRFVWQNLPQRFISPEYACHMSVVTLLWQIWPSLIVSINQALLFIDASFCVICCSGCNSKTNYLIQCQTHVRCYIAVADMTNCWYDGKFFLLNHNFAHIYSKFSAFWNKLYLRCNVKQFLYIIVWFGIYVVKKIVVINLPILWLICLIMNMIINL